VRGVDGAERKMAAPKCRHFHCKVYLVSQIASRQLRGTDSIPVHGSNKTNDEVVAKLLT